MSQFQSEKLHLSPNCASPAEPFTKVMQPVCHVFKASNFRSS